MKRAETVGNYELLGEAGHGSFGTVWKTRRRDQARAGAKATPGEIVALKRLPSHLAGNPIILKRFEREYEAAHALCHPNLVRALDYSGASPQPFLVLEYVEGESLGDLLQRRGRLPEIEAVVLLLQVCQGLSYAHQRGIIHRDIKPDNILVARTGQVKLTDLGLIRNIQAELDLTRTGRGLGTPNFMAPEQFRNAKTADVRSDTYSLGATLYMMVTGELPFRGAGPLEVWQKKVENQLRPARSLAPTLSDRADWVIRTATSFDPHERPSCCEEMLDNLLGPLFLNPAEQEETGPDPDWYLLTPNNRGRLGLRRMKTAEIYQAFEQGELVEPRLILVSQEPRGEFQPLLTYPSFGDLQRDVHGDFRPQSITRTPAPIASLRPIETGQSEPLPGDVSVPPRFRPRRPRPTAPPDAGNENPTRTLTQSPNPHLASWMKWLALILIGVAAGLLAGSFVTLK